MAHFLSASLTLCLAGFCLLGTDAAAICRQRPTDFYFMLDGSRSVRPSNFVLMKNYVKAFVDLIDELGPEAIQIGVVQFSSRTLEEIRLNNHTEKDELKQAIEDIDYMQMGTMTGEALEFFVNEILKPSHGSRLHRGVATMLIILTDGKSQDYSRGTLTEYQRKAKNKGVEIFAIGIGRRANRPELLELASIPKDEHVYQVARFEDIEELELRITRQATCDEDECASNTHNCEHICTNTDGSFVCTCREGYELQEDQRSCVESFLPAPVPSRLWITNITHTSSVANWQVDGVISDDAHYVLGYERADGNGEQEVVRVEGGTRALFVDLQPSTRYRVQLSTVTTDEFSSPIEANFTTLSLGRTKVVLSNATLTTITASWTPAGGDGLTGYEVLYQRVDENDLNTNVMTTIRFGPDIHRTVLNGLEPDTAYNVRVVPRHGAELVGVSSTDTHKTVRLFAPYFFFTMTSLSTISIRWQIKQQYHITSWFITYYPQSDVTNRGSLEINADVYSTVIRQLQPDTVYNVEVAAHIEDGGRQFVATAREASKRTRSLKKPIVTVTRVTTSTMSLKWKELNYEANSWRVKIFPKGKSSLSKQINTNRNQRIATFTGLWPSTTYRIQVTGYVREDEQTFTSPTGHQKRKTRSLVAPTFEVRNATYSSLTVSWRIINEPVDIWIVKMYQDDDQDILQMHEVNGNKTEQVFRNLEENTRYRFLIFGRLRRDGEDFESPKSFTSGTTEILFEVPILVPTVESLLPTVTISDITPISLNARWHKLSVDVDSWSVRIRNDNDRTTDENEDRDSQASIVDGSQLNIAFNDLIPDSPYVVEVRGIVGAARSAVGASRSRTNSLVAPTVTILHEDIAFSSLAVQWSGINTPVVFWSVILYNDENDSIQQLRLGGNVHRHLFTGLNQGSRYTIQVGGIVSSGGNEIESPFGRAVATTGMLVAPQVQVNNITPISFRAYWNAINSEVDVWTITLQDENNLDDRSEILVSNDRSVNIANLLPNTRYRIEVTGSVGEIKSPVGRISTETTRLSAPTVQITSITFQALTVTWSDINVEEMEYWQVDLHSGDTTNTRNFTRLANQISIRETVFDDLKQNTIYEVTVIGGIITRRVLRRSPAGTASAITDELSAPEVEVSLITPFSSRVMWNEINYPVDEWIVKLKLNDPDETIQWFAEFREIVLEGSEFSKEVLDLNPDTKYIIDVTGKIGDIKSRTGQRNFRTMSLTAPRVEIADTSYSTLTARWGNINVEVDSWRVSLSSEDDENVQAFDVLQSNHEKVFVGLDEGTSYTIQVIGVIERQEMEQESPAGEATSTTKSLISISGPFVECVNTDVTSVTVEWSDVSSDVTTWKVAVFMLRNDRFVKKYIRTTEQKTLQISDLLPQTIYKIRVHGNVREGELTFKTQAGVVNCSTGSLVAPILTIQDEDITFSSLAVQWSDINTPVEFWNVKLYNDENEVIKSERVDRNVYRKLLTGLNQGSRYTIQVRGIVSSGEDEIESPFGQAVASTGMLVAPQVQVNNITPTSLRAYWNAINSEVDVWTITLQDENNLDDRSEISVSNERSVNIANLIPNTRYRIEVTGSVGEIKSPVGRISTETTRLSAPTVQITSITYQALTVTWSDINVEEMEYWQVDLHSGDTTNTRTFTRLSNQIGIRETVFDDLKQNTIYEVTVIGGVITRGVLRRSPAGTASAITDELSAPEVEVSSITPFSSRVMWNEINYPVDEWVVRLKLNDPDETIQREIILEGSEFSKEMLDLNPNTEYIIDVTGRIGDTKSRTGQRNFRTMSLTAPRVEIADTSYSTLTARWGNINVEVDSWRVSLSSEDDENVQAFDVLQSNHEKVFDGLDEGTSYTIQVVGVIERQEMEQESPAGEATSTTKSLTSISGPFVECVNTDVTSVTVEWSDVSSDVTSWKVAVFMLRNDMFVKKYTRTTEQKTLQISDLLPQTIYKIRVHGNVREGELTFKTQAGVVNCSTGSLVAPTLTILDEDITFSSLTVQWSNINTPVEFWNVKLYNDENEAIESERVDRNVYRKLLTGLNQGSRYTIQVRGIVSSGEDEIESPFGQAVTSTGMLVAPQVQVNNITPISLRAYWNAINSEVDVWTITLQDENNLDDRSEISVSNERSVNIANLIPNTRYRIEVTGSVGEIKSPVGRISTETTRLSAPTVQITNTTFQALTVTWSDINVEEMEYWQVDLHSGDTTNTRTFTRLSNQIGTRETVFDDLKQNTIYEVTVIGGVITRGVLRRSPAGTASAITDELSAPEVEVSSITHFSSRVMWNEINYPVDEWVVRLKLNDPDETIQREIVLEGSEFSKEMLDLNPNTEYIIDVTGRIGDVISRTGQRNFRTMSLTAPRVEIADTSYSTLTARWGNINVEVDSWRVSLSSEDDENVQAFDVLQSNHEKVFVGLDEGTSYTIQVVGVIERQEMEQESPAGEATSTTKSLISISGPFVECVNTDVTSVTVEWSDVSSDVTSWKVAVFMLRNDRFVKKYTRTTEQKTLQISDLLPQTIYKIRVHGNVREGELTFKTQAGVVNCSTDSLVAPTVTILDEDITFSSLAVQWSDINTPVEFWNVKLYNDENEAIESERVDRNVYRKLLTGLNQGSRYTIQVRGIVSSGEDEIESPFGQAVTSTGMLVAPQVQVNNITPISLRAYWNAINSEVDVWTITLQDENNLDDRLEISVSNDRSVNIANLIPNTRYRIEVTGNVGEMKSPVGRISTETTRLSAPTVQITSTTYQTLTVTWSDINVEEMEYWQVDLHSGDTTNTKNFTRLANQISIRETVFDDLKQNTIYEVTVIGGVITRGVLRKSPVGTASATTDELSASEVEVSSITPFSSRVMWNEINYPVNEWVVRLYINNLDNDAQREFVLEGSEFNKEVLDLNPDTEYIINVTGKIDETRSKTGQRNFRTKSFLPPALECILTTVNSITLRWYDLPTASMDAWVFEIHPYLESDQTTNWEIERQQDLNQYNVLGLKPQTEYTAIIRGKITIGNRTYTTDREEVYCTTKNLTIPSVIIDEITPISLRATWGFINQAVNSWTVALYQVQDDGDSSYPAEEEELMEIESVNVVGNKSTNSFENLSPDTEYLIEVQGSVNDIKSKIGRSRATTRSLTAPTIEVVNSNTTSIEVRWQPINVPVDFWDVELVTNVEGEQNDDRIITRPVQILMLDGRELNVSFGGLVPDTFYQIHVHGQLRWGLSPRGTVNGFTEPLESPLVEIRSTTLFTLTTRWGNINAKVANWIVDIIDDESRLTIQSEILGATVHETTFESLYPHKRYRVKVIGVVQSNHNQTSRSPPGYDAAKTRPIIAPIVSIPRVTSTTLGARWGVINVEVDSWTATLRVATDADEGEDAEPALPIREVALPRNRYSTVFVDLLPDTQYTVEVVGNAGRFKSLSGTARDQTSTVRAPFVMISGVTATSLRVRWEAINLPVESWTIAVSKNLEEQDENITTGIMPRASSQVYNNVILTSGVGLVNMYNTYTNAPCFLNGTTMAGVQPKLFHFESTVEGDRYDAEFHHLQPGTSYKIGVVGHWKDISSPPGEIIGDTGLLVAPFVRINDVSYVSITPEWEDINVEVDRWRVTLLSEEDEVLESVEIGSNVHEKRFAGLDEGTAYNLEVVGVATINGVEHASPAGKISDSTIPFVFDSPTADLGPFVECIQANMTSLTVQWSDVGIDVTSWTAIILSREDKKFMKKYILAADEQILEIRELWPQTLYTIRVHGNVSEEHLSYKTKAGDVNCSTGMIQAPTVVVIEDSITFSSIPVRWEKTNTPVEFWSLTVQSEDSEMIQTERVEGDILSKIFTGLDPETDYSITVRGIILVDDEEIEGAATQVATSTGYLGSPYIECLDTNLRSITLEWFDFNENISMDAWEFEAYRFDAQNETLTWEVVRQGDPNVYNVTNLKVDTAYIATIRGRIAIDNKTYLTHKEEVYCVTEHLIMPFVEVDLVTPVSLQANWHNINYPVDSWTVSIRRVLPRTFPAVKDQKKSVLLQNLTVEGNVNKYVFDGLIPHTEYAVEVIGNLDEIKSNSGRRTAVTRILGRPNPRYIENKATSISFGWGEINVPVDFWIFKLYLSSVLVENTTISEKNSSGEEFVAKFSNLIPGSVYEAHLIGHLRGKASPIGYTLGVTKSIEKPYVKITQTSSSSLTVIWEQVNVNVTFWHVQFYGAQGNLLAFARNFTVDGTRNEILVENLNPSSRYIVDVVGVLEIDQNTTKKSPIGHTYGDTDALTAPVVKLTQVSPTSLRASWSSISVPVDTWSVTLSQIISLGISEENNTKSTLKTTSIHGDIRSILFDGLIPGVTYAVGVVGNIQQFTSPPGTARNATDMLTSPSVDIHDASVTSLIVRWENINEDVISWIVEVTNKDTGAIKNFTVIGSDREFIFEDLAPQKPYNFSITGVIDVNGNLTIHSPPGVVEGNTLSISSPQVEIYDVASTSLRAKWTDINALVDEWIVTIRKDIEELNGYEPKEVVVDANDYNIEFDGLLPATQYTVQVIGRINQHHSPPGQASNTTKPLSSPLLLINDATVGSLSLQWEDINEEVVSWFVQAENPALGDTKSMTILGSEHEVTFEDLDPGTLYNFSVAGMVELNGETTIHSLPGIAEGRTKPLTSPKVNISEITPTSLRIVWTGINTPVDAWSVEIRRSMLEDATGSESVTTVSKEEGIASYDRTAVFDGLLPATLYTVEVIGEVKWYESPPGQVSDETAPLLTPIATILNSTLSTIAISWSNINAIQTNYSMEISNDKIGISKRYTQTGKSPREFIFDNLKPGRNYQIAVRGVVMVDDEEAQSPPAIVRGRTVSLRGPHVDCVQTSASSVTVEWTTDDSSKLRLWKVKIFPEEDEENVFETFQELNVQSYTFTEMLPATTYIVEVQGIASEGGNEFKTPKMNDSCTTRPLPPRNLRLTEQGLTHLFATFEPTSDDVTEYEASCASIINETQGVTFPGIVTQDLTVKCLNLKYVTKYRISVRSVYKDLLSEAIFIINMTRVPPPFNLTLRNVTTHTILAEWEVPVIQGFDRYDIIYDSIVTDEETIAVEAFQRSYLLTDLEPGTQYLVQINAAKNNIITSQSRDVRERTLEETIQLQIDDVGYTSINVSWSRSNVPHLQSYTLRYASSLAASNVMELDLPPDVTNYSLSNLQSATEYLISIGAKYRRSSSRKTQRFATTLAPSPVGPLTFTNVTEFSFVTHWLPPRTQPLPTSYTVTYYTEEMQPSSIENIRDTQLLLDELLPSTVYNVTVLAVYKNEFESHDLKGSVTTQRVSSCSCSTYINAQSQMQSLLLEMMQKIDLLTQKVENLTRSRSTRSARKRRTFDKKRN